MLWRVGVREKKRISSLTLLDKQDKGMKMWNKIKEFFIDWVWQLPQNILGLVYGIMIRNSISYAVVMDSNPTYEVYLKETDGGVTLGRYIFMYKRYNNLSYVVLHELGHVKQSRMLGPLYLFVIGIPSILWAATHKLVAPKKDYYWFYTESWANKLIGIDV
jgi:hypothetical protein